jgi:predicted adenylyl cyclase CyaB
MEIEAKLQYKNKKVIIQVLKNNHFNLIKKIKVKDSYFGQGHSSMSDTNQLYRIREINNNLFEFTYKNKISEKGKITKRQEINVSIDNPASMHKILLSLGCQLIKENYSEKEIWEKGNIRLEFIENKKPQKIKFIEIESISDKTITKLIDLLREHIEPVGEEIFSNKSN